MALVSGMAFGLLVLAYGALCVLSFLWMLRGGEIASVKPADWIAKALFWHGVFVMGSLMLGGGLVVAMALGRLAWGH